jgi:hypothetical protein
MAEIFTAIEAVQGCVHAFHLTHHLVLPLRSSGALCPSILVMSRLAVGSQTITIHGASEFGYNPDHTVDFFPGGTGGNGGAGGVSGGGGGEGPRTSLRYDIAAESFILTNNLYVYGLVPPHRLIVSVDASIQSQHYNRATQKR